MKYKFTQRQFNILIDRFNLIGDNGLQLKMKSDVAKEYIGENKDDGKSYIVNFSLNGFRSKLKVFSANNFQARKIAIQMLPAAKIFNAIEVR